MEEKARVRLQKILQATGFGPRRRAEELIKAGRVKVNGAAATIGDKASFEDSISVDDSAIDIKSILAAQKASQIPMALMYCKRCGEEVSHRSADYHRTIYESLPNIHPKVWIPIGRLAIRVEGIQLVVSDGNLAEKLNRSYLNSPQRYVIRIANPDAELFKSIIPELLSSIDEIEAILPFLSEAKQSNWYLIEARGGASSGGILKLIEGQGVRVKQLKRFSYAGLTIEPSVPAGMFAELDQQEISKILSKIEEENLNAF